MNRAFSPLRRAAAGFTMIEALVVVAIIGIFLVVSIPSILNVMAVRNLENKTREVQTFLQLTKQRSVSTKIVHRVRFYQPEGTYWAYDMERLEADGTWTKALPSPPKTIPTSFNVTITFPAVGADHVASFSALGTYPAEAIFSASGNFPNFDPTRNSITIQSQKLEPTTQDDERVLSIFMGGSIHYASRRSS
jgi:prepilin-type N-terminal cleavage/methylation domain-containing protein